MPVAPKVRYFAPQYWGELDRFTHLYYGTYQLSNRAAGYVKGAGANFRRAYCFRRLAESAVPKLDDDQAELENKGFSSASRAEELAALIEATTNALYSSLDATTHLLKELYPKCKGLPDSTRKTFRAAKEGKIGEALPQPIRQAYASADWYPPFRALRDALTHSSPGFCTRDKEAGKVVYFHEALRTSATGPAQMPHNEDMFGTLDGYLDAVNRFLGEVFKALNATLNDNEVPQMCGVFGGLAYMRAVRPKEAIDFNSGRCTSFEWFDKPGAARCPFADTCLAYVRGRAKGASS